MKSSEILRGAINTLAMEEGDETWKSRYLCVALLDVERHKETVRKQKISNLIDEELMAFFGDKLTIDSVDLETPPLLFKPELQYLRGMYAEFLACYFESIGD